MNIKELAKQAGELVSLHDGSFALFGNETIERFAELVAAAEREACAEHYLGIMRDAVEQAVLREREACAKLCEKSEYWEGVVAKCFANAIRARSK